MLVRDARVLDRHFPTAEFDQFSTESLMGGKKRSAFHLAQALAPGRSVTDEHQATPDALVLDKCRASGGKNPDIPGMFTTATIAFRVAWLTADLFWNHSPPQKKGR